MKHFDNFIDGSFQRPSTGSYLDNYHPATGRVYSGVADSSSEDVNQAVNAAKKAFKEWSSKSIEERACYLRAIARGIENRAEEFALSESYDQGKPVQLARSVDIKRAASNFDFFAGAIEHSTEMATHHHGDSVNYSLRQPLGVAGLISPWNLPLYLLTWKIAPAIAVGNTCVAKCSEWTPATANLLCEVFQEVGLPGGVVNLVHGTGLQVGRAITSHPDIPLVSFTGSTATAIDIQKSAAPYFKKLSLELGGKNPNLVFEDCDLEKAVQTSVRAAFTNQGEICLCGSRIFVQDGIYESFLERFVEESRKFKPGDPSLETTKMGALVSRAHYEKVLSYIELAIQEGGRIALGGEPSNLPGELSQGYFIEPTIVTELAPACRVLQEEIFGPVVSISSFSSEAQVLDLANDIPYGLSATIWTENLSRAHRVAEKVQAGIVWVNTWMQRDLRTPFGGVKHSGVGREGGEYSLEFYTEAKNVCVKY